MAEGILIGIMLTIVIGLMTLIADLFAKFNKRLIKIEKKIDLLHIEEDNNVNECENEL